MTEKTIQNGLFDFLSRSGQKLLCPNYTPAGWWECDLFTLTRSGYWSEYEIKISAADFRADAQKERSFWNWDEKRSVKENKHHMLTHAHASAPTRFFYVVPEELAAKIEVPPFAGLIHCWESRGRIRFSQRKAAPRLHKLKAAPEVVAHVQGVFCARYWNLRRGLKEDAAA